MWYLKTFLKIIKPLYIATYLCHLKRLIDNKHEGVRYPCNQCDHIATYSGNIKKH